MNILKHGDPKRTKRILRFECKECGCVWNAGPHEVYRGVGGLGNGCYCPECYELTKGEPYEEPAGK